MSDEDVWRHASEVERRAEEIVNATLECRWQRLLECRGVPEFRDRVPFVGGPWHGRFVSVPGLPVRYVVAVARPNNTLAATHNDCLVDVMDEGGRHEYQRFRIVALNARLWRWAYASSGLVDSMAMDMSTATNMLRIILAEVWIAAAPQGHGNAAPQE